MKVKVTRNYSITTVHDIALSEDEDKVDGRLALAIKDNTCVLHDIRKLRGVTDAGCLAGPVKLEIVFPARKSTPDTAKPD